jgi:hypothetical protein
VFLKEQFEQAHGGAGRFLHGDDVLAELERLLPDFFPDLIDRR